MDTSISGLSKREQQRLLQVLKPAIEVYGDNAATNSGFIEMAVQLLKSQVESNPNDAFWWYLLADWRNRNGEYRQALSAYRCAYDLEPQNPRTVHGLASIHNTLSYADYVTNPQYAMLAQISHPHFNPQRAMEELDALGMTAEQAAQQALTLYSEVLNFRMSRADTKIVRQTIATLRQRFPQLTVLEGSIAASVTEKDLPDLPESPYEEPRGCKRVVYSIFGLVLILSLIQVGIWLLKTIFTWIF